MSHKKKHRSNVGKEPIAGKSMEEYVSFIHPSLHVVAYVPGTVKVRCARGYTWNGDRHPHRSRRQCHRAPSSDLLAASVRHTNTHTHTHAHTIHTTQHNTPHHTTPHHTTTQNNTTQHHTTHHNTPHHTTTQHNTHSYTDGHLEVLTGQNEVYNFLRNGACAQCWC